MQKIESGRVRLAPGWRGLTSDTQSSWWRVSGSWARVSEVGPWRDPAIWYMKKWGNSWWVRRV